MKEFQVNGKQYVAVEVPGDATNFENDGHVLMYDRKISGILYASAKTLPAGNYKIIGKVRELVNWQYQHILGIQLLDNPDWTVEMVREYDKKVVTFKQDYNLSDNHLIIERI